MNRAACKEFESKYPELARKLVELGTKLYEMGADAAKQSPEIGVLLLVMNAAPAGARQMLGFAGTPDVDVITLLTFIFECGSEKLLAFVREN